jgi:hypothetical protein
MNSNVVCKRCQRLGRAVCECWLGGWAAVVPIKNGLPPAYVARVRTSSDGKTDPTAATTTSISTIPRPL